MSRFKQYMDIIQETKEDNIFSKINFENLNMLDNESKESIIKIINDFNKNSFIKQILNSESEEWKKTDDSFIRDITPYFYKIINEFNAETPPIVLETFNLYKDEKLEFISPKGNNEYLKPSYFGVAREPISNPITLKINKVIIFEKESEKNMNEIINAIMNGLINTLGNKEK